MDRTKRLPGFIEPANHLDLRAKDVLLEAQLAGSYRDHKESARLSRQIEQRRAALDKLLVEWEQAGRALEESPAP